jgi:hypothetical protein
MKNRKAIRDVYIEFRAHFNIVGRQFRKFWHSFKILSRSLRNFLHIFNSWMLTFDDIFFYK